MKPRKQALDFPATPVAAQHAAILGCFPASCAVVWSNQFHAEAIANLCVQGVAVVSAITDQPFGSFGEEAPLDGAFHEFCFMRRSAGQVYGERKTMDVGDRHDSATFAATSSADSRALIFPQLK